MGQMQAAILAGLVSDWLGVEHLREYEVRFVAPVFLGDLLELSAEVAAIETHNGTSIASIGLTAAVAGNPVVSAAAKVVVSTA
jgi:acyl dehydratase